MVIEFTDLCRVAKRNALGPAYYTWILTAEQAMAFSCQPFNYYVTWRGVAMQPERVD
jgi:hypothetical protein